MTVDISRITWPTIYDQGTDVGRPVTQEDVDRLCRVEQAYTSLLISIGRIQKAEQPNAK